jgi:hypothetical protein
VLILTAISAEIFCSVVLIHQYRWTGLLKDGSYQSSALIVLERALGRTDTNRMPPAVHASAYEFSQRSEPAPFLKADDVFGYSANPGTFKHIYRRRLRGTKKWEIFPVQVTINDDGSRWTGKTGGPVRSSIFVFGDSFVFGNGVNDEQTFSYLLQAAHPDKRVHLFALGGYGLAQTYLRFKQIKDQLSSEDIVVLGYADYLDIRNVAAPSRLRQVARWVKRMKPQDFLELKIPKAAVGPDGDLVFALVDQNCEASKCEVAEPTQDYMTSISARLINEIAELTPARVMVLHFKGSKTNPLFAKLDRRVEVISALSKDFGYFIQDDIEAFDPHPGPYWHYAIYRLLKDRLN